MRLATFNILHGRLAGRRRGGRRPAARGRAGPRRRRPRAAGGRPSTSRARSGADLTAVAAEAMGAVAHRFVAALAGTPGATWMRRHRATSSPARPRTASRCCRGTPCARGRWCGCRGSRSRFPMYLPGPPTGDRRRRGTARRRRRAARHPARPAHGRQHAPVVRAGVEPASAAPAARATRRASPVRCVLLGDLNLDAGRGARRTGYRSLAAAPTFPADAPSRQLDHVLTDARTCRDGRRDAGRADLRPPALGGRRRGRLNVPTLAGPSTISAESPSIWASGRPAGSRRSPRRS